MQFSLSNCLLSETFQRTSFGKITRAPASKLAECVSYGKEKSKRQKLSALYETLLHNTLMAQRVIIRGKCKDVKALCCSLSDFLAKG